MKNLFLIMVICWCAVVQGQNNNEKIDLKLPKYDGYHLNNAGDWLIGMGVSAVVAVVFGLNANRFPAKEIDPTTGKTFNNPDHVTFRTLAIGSGVIGLACPIFAGVQLKRHYNKTTSSTAFRY
jgi:hypothetical protein